MNKLEIKRRLVLKDLNLFDNNSKMDLDGYGNGTIANKKMANESRQQSRGQRRVGSRGTRRIHDSFKMSKTENGEYGCFDKPKPPLFNVNELIKNQSTIEAMEITNSIKRLGVKQAA